MPVSLDNMTSYERRIIHNILTDFKGVKTESEGEEPNRHVVIKPLLRGNFFCKINTSYTKYKCRLFLI